MKLLLVNPANKNRKGFVIDPSTCYMPIGLGIVAALTPSNWDVELLDESFEEFTLRSADVVAFTGFTANAARAYEIATICREAGMHTVMGGIHASMYTGEVMEYMDTVVTGEAEGAWPAFITDFEAGETKRLYDGGIVDIKNVPRVRRDIYKHPYNYDLVQTSRGCPWGCEFCSVTHMCGKTYRERDVEDVLNELEETTRPIVFFVDDNLVNHKKGADERAIRLFKGMVERGMKKFWFTQVALNFADNDEVLYWARKSGCMGVLMGIEAESPAALKDVRKNLNLKRGVDSYKETFRKIHKHGMGVLASVMFGMESDRKEDLFARGNFIRESSMDTYQTSIVTPFPGTILFDRMKSLDRIVRKNYPHDWQLYDGTRSVMNTASIKPEEMENAVYEIWLNIYDKAAMRRKMFRTLWNTKSFLTAYWAYAANHNYARINLEGVPRPSVSGSAWRVFRNKFYLKFTDMVLWIIYQLVWTRMIRKLAPK
ncbi:MAG: radical SAM protein [Bacteroidetes bacterium]|nr:radical SAM protein [Bacteroidota bacterium]